MNRSFCHDETQVRHRFIFSFILINTFVFLTLGEESIPFYCGWLQWFKKVLRSKVSGNACFQKHFRIVRNRMETFSQWFETREFWIISFRFHFFSAAKNHCFQIISSFQLSIYEARPRHRWILPLQIFIHLEFRWTVLREMKNMASENANWLLLFQFC